MSKCLLRDALFELLFKACLEKSMGILCSEKTDLLILHVLQKTYS